MYKLHSDRLVLEILSPECGYNGQRFDHCGIIRQVTVDGNTTFCSREFETQSERGGMGLCNEFGIFHPIHVDGSKKGDWFPKIGVGNLKRETGRYRFDKEYACEKSSVDVTYSEHAIHFATEHRSEHDVALRYEKNISIENNAVVVDFTLRNIGRKRIVTTEYCHNFLALNAMPPADGLILHMYNDATLDLPDCLSYNEHGGLRWLRRPSEQMHLEFQGTGASGLAWEMYDSNSACGIRESSTEANYGFSLFCTQDYVSPEAFIKVDVEAGGSMSWTRFYEFAVDGRWLNGNKCCFASNEVDMKKHIA